MHKVILLIAMTILSNSAMAEWTKISKTNDGSITYYLDSSAISSDGNIIKVWEFGLGSWSFAYWVPNPEIGNQR